MSIRLACAALVVVLPGVPAQQRTAPDGHITCNERHVFVLRGDTVIQLDAETLKIKRQVVLPGGATPIPPVAVEEVVEAIEVEEVEPVVEVDPAAAKLTATAVQRGLAWLAAHQEEAGCWDADGFMKHDVEGEPTDGPGHATNDVGVTGLALLAFLGDGHTLRSGKYREHVKRAAKWLRDQQDADTGLIGSNASSSFIYNHAIATLAVVEAYGLSDYKILKKTAQQAINYLERHRNPYAVWRYQPRDNDNDTSVTAWCVAAYKAGQHFDLEVNDQALRIAAAWFDQMTDPVTGRTGYTERGGRSSRGPGDRARRHPTDKTEAMTAATLFCRYLLGQSPEKERIMRLQADLIASKPPKWDPKSGTIDPFYWYYGALAAYQTGGRVWNVWQRGLTRAVARNQRVEGNFLGSWDPEGPWGEEGGRVYTTALLTLALETSYRYSRLVR